MPNFATISIGPFQFTARLEEERAPQTCAEFRKLSPFHGNVVHARWSGEAVWMPLDTLDLGLEVENPVHQPQPGQILFFPIGISETEILIPYGTSRFASVAGPLHGSHFMTITDGIDNLEKMGKQVLWQGRHAACITI